MKKQVLLGIYFFIGLCFVNAQHTASIPYSAMFAKSSDLLITDDTIVGSLEGTPITFLRNFGYKIGSGKPGSFEMRTGKKNSVIVTYEKTEEGNIDFTFMPKSPQMESIPLTGSVNVQGNLSQRETEKLIGDTVAVALHIILTVSEYGCLYNMIKGCGSNGPVIEKSSLSMKPCNARCN